MNSNPGGAFRPTVLLALALILASCAGLSYSHTGRMWDLPGENSISSDTIAPSRDVTLAVTGTLAAGSVTVTVYADDVAREEPLSVSPAASVNARRTFDYAPGLWRFEAEAADGSSGSLYIEIEDR